MKICKKGLHRYTPGKGCPDCKKAANSAWQKNNLFKHNASSKKWRDSNPDKQKESEINWLKRNPGKASAKTMRRRASKMRAMPKWLSSSQLKEIEQFYTSCPAGYEVDHIIPLQGKDVCGLHVPWNLQILDIKSNKIKGNKYEKSQFDVAVRLLQN